MAAAGLTADQVHFFEKHIRPLLVENCYQCTARAGKGIKGGFSLDTQDGLLKGGDGGGDRAGIAGEQPADPGDQVD